MVTSAVTDRTMFVGKDIIHFYDVSGLKYDRKRWIAYFDNVDCVIFVTSLAGYNKFLEDEPTINQMVDSLVLFENTVNNPLLKDTPFILLLNKLDLFKHKVGTYLIKPHFPEFRGKETLETVGTFIKNKFLSQGKNANIVVHVSCCTNIPAMRDLLSRIM